MCDWGNPNPGPTYHEIMESEKRERERREEEERAIAARRQKPPIRKRLRRTNGK